MKRSRVWVAIAGLVAVVLGVVAWARYGSAPIPFEADRWARGDTSVRTRMIEDLLADDRLRGLRTEEVVAVLGEPDCRASDSTTYDLAFVWQLGDSYLFLFFDADGRCVHWKRPFEGWTWIDRIRPLLSRPLER